MGKIDIYVGDYLLLDEVDAKESERLASNLCIVGMPLQISYLADTDTFKVLLPSGESIGTAHPTKNRLIMRSALDEGWTCKAWLSLVFYNNDTKCFQAEIVYQFYNLKKSQTAEQQALDSFAQHTSERLASGLRPDVSLTGTAYETVIETGDWYDGSKKPLPIDTKRSSGMVVFKRKRSIADKVAIAAMEHNPGCRIALIVAAVIIVAIIVVIAVSCSSQA